MADDLEKRLQQEIDRLKTSSSGSGRITIERRSPSSGTAPVKTIHIHAKQPPSSGGGGFGQTASKGNAAAQVNSDYFDVPTDVPATGDAPYASPFRPPSQSPFSGLFHLRDVQDPERILNIVLWVITGVGILAILFHFQAITEVLFLFFATLLVNLSSFFLVVGIIVVIVGFIVVRMDRRRRGR